MGLLDFKLNSSPRPELFSSTGTLLLARSTPRPSLECPNPNCPCPMPEYLYQGRVGMFEVNDFFSCCRWPCAAQGSISPDRCVRKPSLLSQRSVSGSSLASSARHFRQGCFTHRLLPQSKTKEAAGTEATTSIGSSGHGVPLGGMLEPLGQCNLLQGQRLVTIYVAGVRWPSSAPWFEPCPFVREFVGGS